MEAFYEWLVRFLGINSYDVFSKLVNMSMTAGFLIFAIILLRLVFRKMPKKYLCILWALVAIRLICPINISSPLSVFNHLNVSTDLDGRPSFTQYNGSMEKPKLDFDRPMIEGNLLENQEMVITEHRSSLYLPPFVGIYLAVMLLLLGSAIYSYLKLRKATSLSIRRESNIYICDEIDSPFILGILQPRIYLPSGLDPQAERYVIAHEKAHLRRLDHVWKPLGFVLLAVYWFNPLIWIAYILLCRDIEAACDEKVINKMDRTYVAGYSQALLSCAVQRRMITACPIAFGEVSVKSRVKNVLNYRKPGFWILLLAVCICLLLGLGFLTNPKVQVLTSWKNDQVDMKELLKDPHDVYLRYWDEEMAGNDECLLAAILPIMDKIKVSCKPKHEYGADEVDQVNEFTSLQISISGTSIHFVEEKFDELWVEKGSLEDHNIISYQVLNPEAAQKLVEAYLLLVGDRGFLDNTPGAVTPCVRIDGEFYYYTGRKSSVVGRCGMMDGLIDSSCPPTELPTKDGQCNFGKAYGYQIGPEEGTIEIPLEDGTWYVFAKHLPKEEKNQLTFNYLTELADKGDALSIEDFERFIDLEYDSNGRLEKRILVIDDSDHSKNYGLYLYAVKEGNQSILEHAILYNRESETSFACAPSGLFYDIRFGNLKNRQVSLTDYAQIAFPEELHSSAYLPFLGTEGGFIFSDQELAEDAIDTGYTGISCEEKTLDHVIGGFEVTKNASGWRFPEERLIKEYNEDGIETHIYQIKKANGEKYYLAIKNKIGGMEHYLLYLSTEFCSEKEFFNTVVKWELQGANLF